MLAYLSDLLKKKKKKIQAWTIPCIFSKQYEICLVTQLYPYKWIWLWFFWTPYFTMHPSSIFKIQTDEAYIINHHFPGKLFDISSQSASRSRFIHCKVIFSFYRTWVLHTFSEDFQNFPNGKAHFKLFSQKTSVRGNAVSYIVIWFIIFFKHLHQILIHFSFIK